MSAVIKNCTRCKRPFTMAEWNELHFVGHQDKEEDGDKGFEMRNCPAPCSSTIIIHRTPEERLKQTGS